MKYKQILMGLSILALLCAIYLQISVFAFTALLMSILGCVYFDLRFGHYFPEDMPVKISIIYLSMFTVLIELSIITYFFITSEHFRGDVIGIIPTIEFIVSLIDNPFQLTPESLSNEIYVMIFIAFVIIQLPFGKEVFEKVKKSEIFNAIVILSKILRGVITVMFFVAVTSNNDLAPLVTQYILLFIALKAIEK